MATTTPLLNVQFNSGWGTQYLMSPKDFATLVEIIDRTIVVVCENYRDVDDYKSVFVRASNFHIESSTKIMPIMGREAFDALKQEAKELIAAKKKAEEAAAAGAQA